jgi:hypothetical protein
MAAVLAFGGLATLATSAGASVRAASKPSAKFCQAVSNIGNVNSGDTPTGDQAKATAKGFKNAAKYAPKKVKSAMNNIASYISQFSDVKSLKDVSKLDPSKLKGYSSSIQTYIKYYLQCSLSDLSGSTTTTEG